MDTLTAQMVERTLTDLDHARITTLLRRGEGAADTDLDLLLDDAQVVAPGDVAPDVVTMYSQVVLADADTGAPRTISPCYPRDAEPAAGFVSVLSPIGAALIGRRVGDMVRWRTPLGGEAAARVVAIPFQPEASGDFTL